MTAARYRNIDLVEAPPSGGEGREFLTLVVTVLVLAGVVLGLLALVADWLAPRIPFTVEQRIARSLPDLLPRADTRDATSKARQAALVQLVARVTRAMDLPAGMTIQVHYVDRPVVNAMASLGGQVFVFRGLLERLQTEDALAAVLAHEIAHVRQRHVARALGRGLVLASGLAMLGINSRGINQMLVNKGLEVGMLAYSRDAESEADELALAALHRLYGHMGGLEGLFQVFSGLEQQKGREGPEWLASHPLTQHRVASLKASAERRGIPVQGPLTPLSPAFSLRPSAPPHPAGPAAP